MQLKHFSRITDLSSHRPLFCNQSFEILFFSKLSVKALEE